MLVDCSILNSVFTLNNFRKLVKYKHTPNYDLAVDMFIKNKEFNNEYAINELYNILSKNYRNEYFYKNTLVNKLLFGVHSPNTTTALSQINMDNSVADLVLINGRATVFEIKTDLDTLTRLESQINDYYKCFKYVVVVTYEDQFYQLEEKYRDTELGIYTITTNDTISRKLKKEPIARTDLLSHDAIFSMLQKSEYETIIKKHYRYLPDVIPADYYTECRKLFIDLPMKNIQEEILKEMKKRKNINTEMFKDIPYSLKSVSYFADFSKNEYVKLEEFLEDTYSRR